MLSAARSFATAVYGSPVPLLVMAAMFWAGNAIGGQLARDEITPLQLVLLRWVGVTLLLWPLFGGQVRAYWSVARPRLGRIILMAFIGFTGFNTLFYVASLYTTGINIGILQGAMPVFIMLGAFLFQATKVGAAQMIGVAGTLLGVAVIATKGAPWQVIGMAWNPGDLIMIAACASYAGYTLLLRGRPDIPGPVFFTLMTAIAMITAIPPAVIEYAISVDYRWPSVDGWLVGLYVTVFPSCLAQIFFLRGVDLIGPGRAGVYTNLVPVFAAGLAVFVLDEVFALYHALALVLVLSGIALAQRPTQ